MTDYPDHLLSAFLDGELDDTQMETLQLVLDKDPQLVKRLEQLALADRSFRDLYAPIAEAPIPERFEPILDRAEAQQTQGSAQILPFQSAKQALSRWAPQLAAAACLGIGLILGSSIDEQDRPSTFTDQIFVGPVATDGALFTALQSTPSGQSYAGHNITLSYATHANAYCREVATATSRALACTTPTHSWQVLVVTAASPELESENYIPAEASATEVFDDYAARLMQGVPLGLDAEAALIDRAWR